MLSAKTRNGATLNLNVGTIGYFADGEMANKTIHKVNDGHHLY
jgi:hypothetical protein